MKLEEFVDPKFFMKISNPEDLECQRNVTFWKEPTGWDTTLCIITLILAIFSLLLVILAIIFRDYPPIKFQHLPLLVLSYIGGLLWALGTLAVNDNYFYPDVNLGFCLFRRCIFFFFSFICLLTRIISLLFILFLSKKKKSYCTNTWIWDLGSSSSSILF